MPTLNRINLDLVLVDNELLIPVNSINTLLKQLGTAAPITIKPEVLESKEETTPTTTQPSITKVEATRPTLNNSLIDIDPESTLKNMSTSVQNKAKQIQNSEAIVAANSMLRNLLEDNNQIFWYKTYTYYGIARCRYNTLICYYTVESRKSKFLSVYIKQSLVKEYLQLTKNGRYNKVTLQLPELDAINVDRVTKTKLCVVHTDNGKQFYQLVKTLVKMFGES